MRRAARPRNARATSTHLPQRFSCNMRFGFLRRTNRTRTVAAALLAASVAACGPGSGPSVRVTIPPRASMRVASDSLGRAGVIRFPRLFRLYASMRGGDRAIRAGTYALHKNAGWGYVLGELRSGRAIIHVVAICE